MAYFCSYLFWSFQEILELSFPVSSRSDSNNSWDLLNLTRRNFCTRLYSRFLLCLESSWKIPYSRMFVWIPSSHLHTISHHSDRCKQTWRLRQCCCWFSLWFRRQVSHSVQQIACVQHKEAQGRRVTRRLSIVQENSAIWKSLLTSQRTQLICKWSTPCMNISRLYFTFIIVRCWERIFTISFSYFIFVWCTFAPRRSEVVLLVMLLYTEWRIYFRIVRVNNIYHHFTDLTNDFVL